MSDGWKEEYYVKSYKLARAGKKDEEIAAILGVAKDKFKEWKKSNKDLAKAISTGRRDSTVVVQSKNGKKENTLSDRERKFVEEYIKCLSLRQSAVAAGYAPNSAHVVGTQLINKKYIQLAIQEEFIHQRGESDVTKKDIVDELARIALFDPRSLFDESGKLVDICSLDEHTARAVKSIRIKTRTGRDGSETVDVDIQVWDKVRALELLARHLGLITHPMIEDKSQHIHVHSDDNPYMNAPDDALLAAKLAMEHLELETKKSIPED